MKNINSYFEQLRFDENLSKSIFAKYFENFRFVFLLILTILIVGGVSFFSIRRSLNPEVEIPIVSVSIIYPGSSPAEVEKQVLIPIENEIKNAKSVNNINSQAREGFGLVSVEFFSSVSTDEAVDEVRRLIDVVKPKLPDEAFDPQVRGLDFENVPVWQFALILQDTTAQSRSDLENIALKLQEEIETLSLVDRVEVSGIEDREIQIVIDPTTLTELSLNIQQLSQIITTAVSSFPAGSVTTGTSDFTVSIDAKITNLDHIRNLPLNINGEVINLGKITTISYKSAPYQKRAFINMGEISSPAVQFSIFKNSNADITKTQQQTADLISEWLPSYQQTVQLIDLNNVAKRISDQISELSLNFASTIALVFLVLFIFLGARQALIASLSIPLTFLISFSVMNITGQSINFLSLFSLLLGLGLLVDDAIVIVEAVTSYYQTNKFTPKQTQLLVFRDFVTPIWTTTITTVWAFLPLLLATGIVGEFIKSIPIVVSSTLIASTAVAVFITLPLTITLLKLKVPYRIRYLSLGMLALSLFIGLLWWSFSIHLIAGLLTFVAITIWVLLFWFAKNHLAVDVKNKKTAISQYLQKSILPFFSRYSSGIIDLKIIADKYAKLMSVIIYSRKNKIRVVIAVIILSIFSYTLLPLGFVRSEFFPMTDSDILYVGVELPIGASIYENQAVTLEIIDFVRKIPEVEITQAVIGAPNNPESGMMSDFSRTNTSLITARLLDEDDREKTSHDLTAYIREELKNYQKARITAFAPSAGPPAGSDVNLKIKGEQLSELEKIALEIEAYLEQQLAVANIDRNIKPGPSKIIFKPDYYQLANQNLNTAQLGFWLRSAISGLELSSLTLNSDTEKTAIMLRLSDRPLTTEQLGTIPIGIISAGQQNTMPLANLGQFELSANPSIIVRENSQRTLTVTASVLDGFSISQTNKDLLKFASELDLPDGYSFDTGGVNEENQRSVQSILQAMGIAVLLILVTMVIQLGSFRQAGLVVLVIPLAVTGVFIVFALTNTPLSFPALIGLLALFGIVVNNSIMLVDKINQNIAVGMKQKTAIIDASASRLQPILLSSLTTITGLIPITINDPIWRGLGGGIISGLFLSGAIMLIFIPVVYDLWYPET